MQLPARALEYFRPCLETAPIGVAMGLAPCRCSLVSTQPPCHPWGRQRTVPLRVAANCGGRRAITVITVITVWSLVHGLGLAPAPRPPGPVAMWSTNETSTHRQRQARRHLRYVGGEGGTRVCFWPDAGASPRPHGDRATSCDRLDGRLQEAPCSFEVEGCCARRVVE